MKYDEYTSSQTGAYLTEPISDSIAALQFLVIYFLDHQVIGGLMKLLF